MTPGEEPPDAERARIDGLFHDIFEIDRRGAEVFEVLYRRFASKARVHTEGGIDAVLKTYRDSAHREVIEFIVMRCNRARGVVDDQQQEPKPTDTRTL
jgi:hypothetical protein